MKQQKKTLNKQNWKFWFSPARCPLCQQVVIAFQSCNRCTRVEKQLSLQNCQPSITVQRVDTIFCPWQYKNQIRHGILQMKFENMPWLAENFILLLLTKKAAYTFFREFDIILWVPSTKKKIKQRGYDVPFLLAKAISCYTGIPLAQKGVLIKVKETIAQVELDSKQRKNNVIDAFAVQDSDAIFGKKVLLVDDVLTTGTTAQENAFALYQSGASRIGLLVLAQAEIESR